MRRRSLESEVLAAVAVGVLVGAAVLVVYVTLGEMTAAARSGLLDRAFQMGAAALLAVVVAVSALAVFSRWRNVTERPDRRPRRLRVPSRAEITVVGLLLAGLVVAAWPVLVHAYRGALEAFAALDLAWAVGYAVGGVAFLWLVVWSLVRYVQWQRLRLHAEDGRLVRHGRSA